jgi:hypothetical protein
LLFCEPAALSGKFAYLCVGFRMQQRDTDCTGLQKVNDRSEIQWRKCFKIKGPTLNPHRFSFGNVRFGNWGLAVTRERAKRCNKLNRLGEPARKGRKGQMVFTFFYLELPRISSNYLESAITLLIHQAVPVSRINSGGHARYGCSPFSSRLNDKDFGSAVKIFGRSNGVLCTESGSCNM